MRWLGTNEDCAMNSFPFDIASRASNLSERIQLVTTLNSYGGKAFPNTMLTAFDRWKIDTLAQKLTGRSFCERVNRGTGNRAYLTSILTAHRLYEVCLGDLEADQKDLLAEIHREWLPTYQRALHHFERAEISEAFWHKPELYYGKFARVCEPFLVQIQRELRPVCLHANASSSINLCTSQLIEDMQKTLLQRFELALAWATEVEANVYCARYQINKVQATTEDYIAFLNETFLDSASYHRFYLHFPLLGRWLAQGTRFLIDNGRMLIERLCHDSEEIAPLFFGQRITSVLSFTAGTSDYHARGQYVMLVDVELESSERASLVYKPRSLHVEMALQRILERLSRECDLHFATYHVLAKDGYGYAERIPSGKNNARSLDEVKHIYEELGGYLGLFSILGGSDLHFENLLIADGHAFVCDGETILGVFPPGQDQPLATVLDSVYRTGLLEWPHRPANDAMSTMKISGYTGGEPFQLPIAQPTISGRRMSFGVSVRHETGLSVRPEATNRVYLDGELARPETFKESILTGFDRVDRWFQQQPPEGIQRLLDLFEESSVRFVCRATQIYTQLLLAIQHPKCLREPLEVDLILSRLTDRPERWDTDGQVTRCELSSLWQLDIPLFTVGSSRRELVHDHRQVLSTTLQMSPLDSAAQRIGQLSSLKSWQQAQYITASLSPEEVQSPSFIATAVEYAQQIGEHLCRLQHDLSEQMPWKSYQVNQQGTSEADIGPDLYNGTAGIALFLAYLDTIVPRPHFRQAAERALSYSLLHRDRKSIGAFQGQAGLVYLLIHLYHLWKDPAFVKLACDLSAEVTSELSSDRDFDVLNGVAGIIPVMIGLSQIAPGEGLPCAHSCAEHLLRHAERDGHCWSWPLKQPGEAKANLTGFAHGAGGIGWALIALGSLTARSDYIEAGRTAFAYEATHFDEDEMDWYDLRTRARGIGMNQRGHHFANAWCNGAAGIGLSRIASWSLLGKSDDALLKDAYLALRATLRNFHTVSNDTLCHGKAGNAEFFLRFALLKEEPAYQIEANVQAQIQWQHFEKARNWIFGGANVAVFPGLMLGLAGFGMHFLRVAYPERISSPLLLDPPPQS
jgi:type 2 lantibiotic biosynthesis protein LanM